MELTFIQKIAIYALPVIFAITVHEAAHGYVARFFGDMTAHYQGRITLNPLKHIDPIGTILLPMVMMLLPGPYIFGWAKPVPVDFSRLRNPKRNMLWVAAAGPGSNLVMAIMWALVYNFSNLVPAEFTMPLRLMAEAGILINVVLMVLNLLPLPPLDGGRIAVSLLPNNLAARYARIEPYGFFILLALLFTGILSQIIGPFIYAFVGLITWLFV